MQARNLTAWRASVLAREGQAQGFPRVWKFVPYRAEVASGDRLPGPSAQAITFRTCGPCRIEACPKPLDFSCTWPRSEGPKACQVTAWGDRVSGEPQDIVNDRVPPPCRGGTNADHQPELRVPR